MAWLGEAADVGEPPHLLVDTRQTLLHWTLQGHTHTHIQGVTWWPASTQTSWLATHYGESLQSAATQRRKQPPGGIIHTQETPEDVTSANVEVPPPLTRKAAAKMSVIIIKKDEIKNTNDT